MRKLKLQMQMTIDGFVAGPNGEQDWLVWDWDEALNAYVDQITQSVDCILLGRVLAQGFIPYWASVAADPDKTDASAEFFHNTPKVVFSNTLESSEWEHTTIAKDDLATEIGELKAQPGQDIIAYGGATFVSNLIKQNLIDEYHLFVNPVALGEGMSIFGKVEAKYNLKLVSSQSFACGIVALHYEK